MTTNPVVLGFLVERFVLSSIASTGLCGLAVDKVEHFSRYECYLAPQLKQNSAAKQTVLYIPAYWERLRFDAVLVSHHRKSAADAAPLANVQSDLISSSGASSSALAEPTSNRASSEAVASQWSDCVHVQFVQISAGAVMSSKTLARTRRILRVGSPEREMWRNAAGDSNAEVKFSLRRFVPRDEVTRIPRTRGFKKEYEKVSPFWAMHSALTL